MATEKINLEKVAALTKELFHAHYAGDLDKWFSYLCPDSVYLGTGEPLLFGGNTIREHFKGFTGKAVRVDQEEYFPVSLGDKAAQVCGQIIVESLEGSFRVINHFTIRANGEMIDDTERSLQTSWKVWRDLSVSSIISPLATA